MPGSDARLEYRSVTSLRQPDDKRVGGAVARIVILQLGPQPPSLDAHHRIGARIEPVAALKDFRAEHGLLERAGFAREGALDQVAEKPAQLHRIHQIFAGQNFFQLLPHRLPGVRLPRRQTCPRRSAKHSWPF